jgi:hypothetical protein
MKMNLYYVVRAYKGIPDSVGRSADCAYVSGPHSSYASALEAKRASNYFNTNALEVVEQTLEVNE